MKIALVILHADVARGGAERYTLDLAEALGKRGHDVSIVASSFQSEAVAGTRVLISTPGKTRTGRYLQFCDAVDQRWESRAFDVVHAMLPIRHCDVYHPHAGIAGDIVSTGHLNKSGLIHQAIGWIGNRTNSRRLRFAAVEKQLLRSADPPVVLCLSNLIQEVIRREYPDLPAEKLLSLFNGIDLSKFDPAKQREARLSVRDRFSITADEVVGLMLAQDFERKGLWQAIEAMVHVPGMVLLVGGKPDATAYQQLAKSFGVADRVIFAGQVENPVAFYQASDFFVLPTWFDPCSLVVLEALAMGLPVISTAKNGACEIMIDGVHGRVLKAADDVTGLSAAMTEMTDAIKRSALSTACLELRGQLSQETHIDRLESVYSQICRSRKV